MFGDGGSQQSRQIVNLEIAGSAPVISVGVNMSCDNCSEEKEDSLDKKAFTLFLRALIYTLPPYRGVVVEGFEEESYVVWHNPESKELVISNNDDNLPMGSLTWMPNSSKEKVN
jgi:hypothetical protein